MKVAKIQNSLKDLHKDIGNCEKQLSRALKGRDQDRGRSQSVTVSRDTNTKPGYRQSNVSHFHRSGTKQNGETSKNCKPRSPSTDPHHEDRNVICKEVIGARNAPTRVEVVIRTKSSSKRSRSAQARRTENDIPTRDRESRRSLTAKNHLDVESHRKNSSWSHILHHQSQSFSHEVARNGQGHGKTLQYPSSDDDRSNEELQRWVQNIPHSKDQSNHKYLGKADFGTVKSSNISDKYSPVFNPLRTLNFLVKELRGKVHKDGASDATIQRIIEDMESTLCCIPPEANIASVKLAPSTSQSRKIPSRLRNRDGDDGSGINLEKGNRLHNQDEVEVCSDGSPNLVDRLMSTVTRITKIAAGAEKVQQGNESAHSFVERGRRFCLKSPSVKTHAESVQVQLELGCKQLEDTCHQMERTCESLRLQNNQLKSDLKTKSQQLDSAISKNQQLTIYAADVRQDILRVQQAAEMAQQECEKMNQKLLSQQQELQGSNSFLNKKLKETLQENERLSTALQLCQLEKDKMHILMSNKDLEVAKLKKEIVDIHTLVTEQLISMRALSGKNCSSEDLDKMMQAVNRLHITIDSANSTLLPNTPSQKEGVKSHIGDGEGSRSRPICSSPTSSVNSSLYSSWQLMSDIMTPDKVATATLPDQNPKDLEEKDGSLVKFSQGPSSKRDEDSGIKVTTPVGMLPPESTTNKTVSTEKRKQSAQELKDGLRDMFQSLKQQTSAAVNISLPEPPKTMEMHDCLGLSQWTELSASESAVLFHSSDESDSDEIS